MSPKGYQKTPPQFWHQQNPPTPQQPRLTSIPLTTEYLETLGKLVVPEEEMPQHGYHLRQFDDYELLEKRRCMNCRRPQRHMYDSLEDDFYDLVNEMRGKRKLSSCDEHPGKLKGNSWGCCKRSAPSSGCRTRDGHESDVHIPYLRPLWTLYPTPEAKSSLKRKAIALDCEMGISMTGDHELIRLSAIDFFTGEILVDSLVWPKVPLLHPNTSWSGITWGMLRGARNKGNCINGRHKALEKLWQYASPETIVVAHGGSSDMLALRWMHRRVLDTCRVEKLRPDGHVRPRLRNLAEARLNRKIQQGQGHDSLEDATACRDLAHWYVVNYDYVSEPEPVPAPVPVPKPAGVEWPPSEWIVEKPTEVRSVEVWPVEEKPAEEWSAPEWRVSKWPESEWSAPGWPVDWCGYRQPVTDAW
ncbi:hypothetical protein NUU61_008335 [Penicillium alfredii]|uniref:Exonuclease domain-containing protein n=1 Tax=Penicillium alfredii TaxID=1506179 RepID=A0A9W9JZ57_9EURO|nr:uncharacterized protein NUU61_008335 [Penicillium alfredii]KAJ5087028.1 hypothetical protein NUU61_008335 [Penicillium alfredii]